jgi:hypothetical protein
MTQTEYEALIRGTKVAVEKLMARGVPREKAIEIATEMAVRAVKEKYPGLQGMGDIPVNPQPLDTLAQESQSAANIAVIKTVRDAVSPWLWVTSLIGFGFSILNRRQIAKMYGDWRKKKGTRR